MSTSPVTATDPKPNSHAKNGHANGKGRTTQVLEVPNDNQQPKEISAAAEALSSRKDAIKRGLEESITTVVGDHQNLVSSTGKNLMPVVDLGKKLKEAITMRGSSIQVTVNSNYLTDAQKGITTRVSTSALGEKQAPKLPPLPILNPTELSDLSKQMVEFYRNTNFDALESAISASAGAQSKASTSLPQLRQMITEAMDFTENFFYLTQAHGNNLLDEVKAYLGSEVTGISDAEKERHQILTSAIADYKKIVENYIDNQSKTNEQVTAKLTEWFNGSGSSLVNIEKVVEEIRSALAKNFEYQEQILNTQKTTIDDLNVELKEKRRQIEQQEAKIVEMSTKNGQLTKENAELDTKVKSYTLIVEANDDRRHMIFEPVLGEAPLESIIVAEYMPNGIVRVTDYIQGKSPLHKWLRSMLPTLKSNGSDLATYSSVYGFRNQEGISITEKEAERINKLLSGQDFSLNYVCMVKNEHGDLFYKEDNDGFKLSLSKDKPMMKDAESALDSESRTPLNSHAHLQGAVGIVSGSLGMSHIITQKKGIKNEGRMLHGVFIQDANAYMAWLSTKKPRYDSGALWLDNKVVLL